MSLYRLRPSLFHRRLTTFMDISTPVFSHIFCAAFGPVRFPLLQSLSPVSFETLPSQLLNAPLNRFIFPPSLTAAQPKFCNPLNCGISLTKETKMSKHGTDDEQPPLGYGDYTVGWVCTLSKEQTAAISMLDKRPGSRCCPMGLRQSNYRRL